MSHIRIDSTSTRCCSKCDLIDLDLNDVYRSLKMCRMCKQADLKLNFRFKVDDLSTNDESFEMATNKSGMPSSNTDKVNSNTSGLGSLTNKTTRSIKKNVDFEEDSIIDLHKSNQQQISKSRLFSTPLVKESQTHRNHDKQVNMSTIPTILDETSFHTAHSNYLNENQSATRRSKRLSPNNLTTSSADSDKNSTSTETSQSSMYGEKSNKSKYRTRRSVKDKMEKLSNYYTPNQSGRKVSKRRNSETRFYDTTFHGNDEDHSIQKDSLPNEPSGIQIKKIKNMHESNRESLKDLFKDFKQRSTDRILFDDSYYDQVELIVMPEKGSFRLNVQPPDVQSTNEKSLRDLKKLCDKII